VQTVRVQTVDRQVSSVIEPPEYESNVQPRSPLADYALAAARHMYEYGTLSNSWPTVAVAARRWRN